MYKHETRSTRARWQCMNPLPHTAPCSSPDSLELHVPTGGLVGLALKVQHPPTQRPHPRPAPSTPAPSTQHVFRFRDAPPCAEAPSPLDASLSSASPEGSALRLPPMPLTSVCLGRACGQERAPATPAKGVMSAQERVARDPPPQKTLLMSTGVAAAALSGTASPRQAPLCILCVRGSRIKRTTERPSTTKPGRASRAPLSHTHQS